MNGTLVTPLLPVTSWLASLQALEMAGAAAAVAARSVVAVSVGAGEQPRQLNRHSAGDSVQFEKWYFSRFLLQVQVAAFSRMSFLNSWLSLLR
jgi:hypothetical protein